MNLPDIAFESHGNINKFWNLLDERCEIAHDGLKTRLKRIANTKAEVAPILWMDGAMARLNADDTLYPLVYGENPYSTVSLGYVGLFECVKILTGQDHDNGKAMELGKSILKYMSDKCEEWKLQEHAGYSLYSSPAESLCYKFATKTKERFPEEFTQLFGNKKYFENSYHIPSYKDINPFTKIKVEAEYQRLATGGCLSYIESADLSHNQEALYPIIEAIYNNIMYCEINTVTSECRICHNSQTIHVHKNEQGNTWWECDVCGNTDIKKMDVAARTCGYIGTNFWNEGKTQEIASRKILIDDHEYNEPVGVTE